ncbi:MAG: ribonuclease D [Pseudomonadales bacterium]|nr:ribonuclease D [Pseudomonadales bacterium]
MKEPADGQHYIASNSDLAQAAALWKNTSALGIDTEFIRTDTFYPIPALIQISDGQQCWLVDVLKINDFSPLAEVLRAPHTTKILHATSEDLEVFDHLTGALPTPLFDTQIAAALCGYGASIGYSRLVHTLLDIELSKDQCRSDWLARPLTHEQQQYACLDVLYLPSLYQQLSLQLATLQRTAWVEEENTRQLARYHDTRSNNYSIDRISNAWRLNDLERQRLWNMILGRDALAQQHNKSRNHIAKDFALFEMAKRPPSHLAGLAAIEGIRSSSIRQFGPQLLQLANNIPADLICPPRIEPLSKAENTLVKNLRSVADQIATPLQIPTELLVRKLEMDQLVRQYLSTRDAKRIVMPERFNGWRKTVIGTALHDEIGSWNGTQ